MWKSKTLPKAAEAADLAAWVWKRHALKAAGVELNIWYWITINLEKQTISKLRKESLIAVIRQAFEFSSSLFLSDLSSGFALLSCKHNDFHNEWIPRANAYTHVPTNKPSSLKMTVIDTDIDSYGHVSITYIKCSAVLCIIYWIYYICKIRQCFSLFKSMFNFITNLCKVNSNSLFTLKGDGEQAQI